VYFWENGDFAGSINWCRSIGKVFWGVIGKDLGSKYE